MESHTRVHPPLAYPYVFSAHSVTFSLFFPGTTTKEKKSLKSVERGKREEELGNIKLSMSLQG